MQPDLRWRHSHTPIGEESRYSSVHCIVFTRGEQSEYGYASSGGPAASNAGPSIGITDIFVTLRREWRFPLFGCLIGLTLGISYVLFVPTLYKSSARILLR